MATASDNFNRANEDPLNTNWEVGGGDWSNMKVVSNQGQISGTGADSAARYTATTFSADQFSECLLTYGFIGSTKYNEGGPGVRFKGGTDESSYHAEYGKYGTEADNLCRIYETDSTLGFTQLGADITGVASGRTVRMEANGTGSNNITLKDGVITPVTRSDATITSGQPGINGYEDEAGQVTIDDWQGGDLAGAAGANPKGPLGMPLHGPFGGPV